ncbi:deoxyribose-phosphate aldolase [Gleimia europaea]|uniref:Deoxyribose-phosphate aldolase n=2 Tax=Actinomycetaceae TaxID=2049 RepID=A0A9W5RD14_9ACTO|nr:deoxyribose-phosphate aldolase [Gleimia europaea ACS-120-V-Col10b]
MNSEEVAKMIDHTLLAPEATRSDILALIDEAEHLGTYSVCVSPNQVPLPRETTLKVAAVCGFPSGAHTMSVKAAEAAELATAGVDEIDMVINVGAVKEGNFDYTEKEIKAVRDAAPNVVLKVIIESAALTDDEIVGACNAARAAKADFVKTSTGFHKAGGASVRAVRLMRSTVGNELGVKASGGIRDGKFASELIEAGATRLGLSSSKNVLDTL